MSAPIAGPEIERLIQALSRLPGLGPRSARRAALVLIKKKDTLMHPLAQALGEAMIKVTTCHICGNVDTIDPCTICRDERRDPKILCVVEDVADLWALERAGAHKGFYHVLGGTLSALDGVRPENLSIGVLIERANAREVEEIILATNATVDGQTTAHYIADALEISGVKTSRLAHGVPVGGELDYLDDGTLTAAMKARKLV